MSAHRTPSNTPPVDGPTFRAAVRLDAGGKARRRVLLLVAAWHDAGVASVNAFELAERLNLPPAKVGALIARLEADGILVRTNRRRRPFRYRLAPEHLPGERDALTMSGERT